MVQTQEELSQFDEGCFSVNRSLDVEKREMQPTVLIIPGFLTERVDVPPGASRIISADEIPNANWVRRLRNNKLAHGATINFVNWPNAPVVRWLKILVVLLRKYSDKTLTKLGIILQSEANAVGLIPDVSIVPLRGIVAISALVRGSISATLTFSVTNLIRFIWKKAVYNADDFGKQLATDIGNYKQPIIIIAHSLGCRVALKTLSCIKENATNVKIILLAAALSADDIKKFSLNRELDRNVEFYCSKEDRILQTLYRIGEIDLQPAIGVSGIADNDICNAWCCDVMESGLAKGGHFQYESALPDILHDSRLWASVFGKM